MTMKQRTMNFYRIPRDFKKIRECLGLSKPKANKKKKKSGDSGGGGGGGDDKSSVLGDVRAETVYHMDWAIVPYVPTQFPSLHRDLISTEEFSELLSEVDAEERERAQTVREGILSESESEDTEDGSDAETRSEDETSDSEMDDFVVCDDHQDTDKEEEEDEDEDEDEVMGNNEGDEEELPASDRKQVKRKRAMKKELKNLGLSSGTVGTSFAVAEEGLGKRTRRQTDHIGPRIMQAGLCEKEIVDYNTYNHEKGEFKEAAYEKPNTSKGLWKTSKKANTLLAITGANAGWAKRAIEKKKQKTKPGQRPCAAAERTLEKDKKNKASIINWLTR